MILLVKDQIIKLTDRFNTKEIVFAGDKKMLNKKNKNYWEYYFNRQV